MLGLPPVIAEITAAALVGQRRVRESISRSAASPLASTDIFTFSETAKGHEVTGFDFLEEAIQSAKRKAVERGIIAMFLVQDALKLREWAVQFDNVIDSGLFHVFSDEDRVLYVLGLKAVLKPPGHLFLACFSDQTPGTQGPRRVSQNELNRCILRRLGNQIH